MNGAGVEAVRFDRLVDVGLLLGLRLLDGRGFRVVVDPVLLQLAPLPPLDIAFSHSSTIGEAMKMVE